MTDDTFAKRRDEAAEAYMVDTIVGGGAALEMEGCLQDFKAGWDACRAECQAEIERLKDENRCLQFNLEQKSQEIGRAEHRGNTVNYIYDKCELYGRQLLDAVAEVERLRAELTAECVRSGSIESRRQSRTDAWRDQAMKLKAALKYYELGQRSIQALREFEAWEKENE